VGLEARLCSADFLRTLQNTPEAELSSFDYLRLTGRLEARLLNLGGEHGTLKRP